MNDTPRTDLKAVVPLDIHSCLEFCRRIERELNAANFDNEKLIEANRFYAMDKSELERNLAISLASDKFSHARAVAAESDQKRLEWLIPLITGGMTPEDDRRTHALEKAILEGLEGRPCIDRAMA